MYKKATKLEKLLIMLIGALLIVTPIITITLSSQGFVYSKSITDMDNEIMALKQETRELEVKKQEKLSYSEIQAYAARDGLTANKENVKRV